MGKMTKVEEVNDCRVRLPSSGSTGKSKNAVALNILITVDKEDECDEDKLNKNSRRGSIPERPAICYDKPKPKKCSASRSSQERCSLVPAPTLPPNSVILPCGCLGFYDECRHKLTTENVFGLCRKDNGCGANKCWDKPGRGGNNLCSTTGCQTQAVKEAVTNKNCQSGEVRGNRKSMDIKSLRTSAGCQTPATCIPKTKEQIVGTENNFNSENPGTGATCPRNSRNSGSRTPRRLSTDTNSGNNNAVQNVLALIREDDDPPRRSSLPQPRKPSMQEGTGIDYAYDQSQSRRASASGGEKIDDQSQSRKASGDNGPDKIEDPPRKSSGPKPELEGEPRKLSAPTSTPETEIQPRKSSGPKTEDQPRKSSIPVPIDQARRSSRPKTEDLPPDSNRMSGDKGGEPENPNFSAGDCTADAVGAESSQCFIVSDEACCDEVAQGSPPSVQETPQRFSQSSQQRRSSNQQPPSFPIDFSQGEPSTSNTKCSENNSPRVTTLRDGTTVEELPEDYAGNCCGNGNESSNECDDDYMIGVRSLFSYMNCGWNIFWKDVVPLIKRKLQQNACDGETEPPEFNMNDTDASCNECSSSCACGCNQQCRNDRCSLVLANEAQSNETVVLCIALPIVVLGLLVSLKSCCGCQ